MKYRRTSTAVRYGIPVANILWISVEIVSGWGLMTEIWLQPAEYWPELLALTGAFTVLSLLIYYAPKKQSEISR